MVKWEILRGYDDNLIFFMTVQKLWKLVHIWQSYHRLCNVLFFMDHSVWTTVVMMDVVGNRTCKVLSVHVQ